MMNKRFKIGDRVKILCGHFPGDVNNKNYRVYNGIEGIIISIKNADFDYGVDVKDMGFVSAWYDDDELEPVIAVGQQLLFDWA